MTRTLEFFFDFMSPYSHIANAAVKDLGQRENIDLEYKPMFLGAVMQQAGNRAPGAVPAKMAYMLIDLQRCAERYGTTIRMHPNFPMVNTRGLLRAAIGFGTESHKQKQFIDMCFRHIWETDVPLSPTDDASVQDMCATEGFDFQDYKLQAEADSNKVALKAHTDSALSRGAFGAPTFFVGDEMFFGHDRLDYAIQSLLPQA